MTRTRELQRHWWDWLSTSERLLRWLNEQTRALIRRDVPTVESLQTNLDEMIAKMQQIDDRAVASVLKLAEELGVEPNLRGLSGALPKAEAQQIQGLANRIKAASQTIDTTMERNRRLIENELDFMHATAAIVMKAATESEGRFASQAATPVLVDQAA